MGAYIDPGDLGVIRDQANIADIVGQKVELSRKGNSYWGLCPFHDDHKPSLYVNPDRGSYHCFVCGEHGDAIKWYRETEGLDFPEAVIRVAGTIGYNLRFSSSAREKFKQTSDMYGALESAAGLYRRTFWNNEIGAKAREYLMGDRGIHEESIREFGIGFAPNQWEYLVGNIGPGSSHGHSLKLLNQVGLISKRRSGEGYYDVFRGRIMFPMSDSTGRVVGFSGRDITGEKEAPKYFNTPQTDLFNKGKILFGVEQSAGMIKNEGRVILTEGYADAVAGFQAGFPTIAVGGIAMTREHVEILQKRWPGLEMILTFDGDDAGRLAAFEASRKLLGTEGAYVCLLPSDEDPASILREEGAASDLFDQGGKVRFDGLLDKKVPAFEYYLDRRVGGRNLRNPATCGAFIDSIAKDLVGLDIPDNHLPIYVSAIADKVNLDPSAIDAAVSEQSYSVHRGRTLPPRDHCETELLRGMMVPSIFERFRKFVFPEMFSSPERLVVGEYLSQGGIIDSTHSPIFQSPSDVVNTLMSVFGDRGLRSDRLYSLLSPASSAKRKTTGYFENMLQTLRAWQAFNLVDGAGRSGHSLDRLGRLVDDLGFTIANWEHTPWVNVEGLPGASVVNINDSHYLLVQRRWRGDSLRETFGGLGRYLLEHGDSFLDPIDNSPLVDIRKDHRLVCFDTEDSPDQVMSITFTGYDGGELRSSTLFARTPSEEAGILQGLLPASENSDRILSFRGSHDFGALRRGISRRFGRKSILQGELVNLRKKHRDVFDCLRFVDVLTPDKSLKTLEAYYFGPDCRGGFDIPSREIPLVYERFVNTGDARLAESIIRHNIVDTTTPIALLHLVCSRAA